MAIKQLKEWKKRSLLIQKIFPRFMWTVALLIPC